jgi:hypothetical protein
VHLHPSSAQSAQAVQAGTQLGFRGGRAARSHQTAVQPHVSADDHGVSRSGLAQGPIRDGFTLSGLQQLPQQVAGCHLQRLLRLSDAGHLFHEQAIGGTVVKGNQEIVGQASHGQSHHGRQKRQRLLQHAAEILNKVVRACLSCFQELKRCFNEDQLAEARAAPMASITWGDRPTRRNDWKVRARR